MNGFQDAVSDERTGVLDLESDEVALLVELCHDALPQLHRATLAPELKSDMHDVLRLEVFEPEVIDGCSVLSSLFR